MPRAALARLSPGAGALPAPWELPPSAGGGTGGLQQEDGARARAAQAPFTQGVVNLYRQVFCSPMLYGDSAGFAFLALLDPTCHPAGVGSFLTVLVLMARKTIVIECPLLTTLCGRRGSTPARLHHSASLFWCVYPIIPNTNSSQLELT